MFVPRKQFFQTGGGYTGSSLFTYISTYNIDASTVSTILAYSNIGPYTDFSQLSVDQISNVIAGLTTSIETNKTTIAELIAHIALIQHNIDKRPDGFQQLYDDALAAYNSTNSAYNTISTLYANSVTQASSLRLQISTLSSSSISISSIIYQLQQEYNMFLTDYLSTQQNINFNISTDQSIYNIYLDKYNKYQDKLSTLNGDRAYLSTLTSISPSSPYISTLLSTIYSLSTGIETINVNSLRYLLSTASSNLFSQLQLSTLYSLSSSSYALKLSTLQAQEALTMSTIQGYLRQIENYNGLGKSLDDLIREYNQTITNALSQLDADAPQFYAQKLSEITSEVREYQYAARERNANLGVITADLKIARLNLYNTVDSLSFQIQAATINGNSALKTTLEGQRLDYIRLQASLQAMVGRIDPLDIEYGKLDTIFNNEITYRSTFIGLRVETYNIERIVLETPQEKFGLETQYRRLWSQMNAAIDSANGKITERRTQVDIISTLISPVRNDLNNPPIKNSLYNIQEMVREFPYSHTMILPQDINAIVPDPKYGIIAPIKFTVS